MSNNARSYSASPDLLSLLFAQQATLIVEVMSILTRHMRWSAQQWVATFADNSTIKVDSRDSA